MPWLQRLTAPGRRVVSRVLLGGGPCLPGMIGEVVGAVGREEPDQLLPLRGGEAAADADVLQRAGVVVEAEQERADGRPLAALVPAEAGDDAVAFALVLDLEHDALVRLVACRRPASP